MNNIIEEEYFLVNELLLCARKGHWRVSGKFWDNHKDWKKNIL